MKKIGVLILLQLALSYSACYSQDFNKKDVEMNKEVDDIIQLGKDSIIQLALKLIDEKASVENFAKIKIMTNGSEVFVSFLNPIKYLPLKSIFYFDVGVNLLEKTTSKHPVANPIEYYDKKDIPYYKQTEDIKRSIQFVIGAMNNMEASDVDNMENEITIRENKKYYDIAVISEFQESSYKIEKVSGKTYDVEHSHLIPPPFENNDKEVFKEIDFQ